MTNKSIAAPVLAPSTRVTIITNHIIPCGMDGTITGIDESSYYPLYQVTTDGGIRFWLRDRDFVVGDQPDFVDPCAGRVCVGGGAQ